MKLPKISADLKCKLRKSCWKLFPQPLYNYLMLKDKNLTVWHNGSAAIAMCPFCDEVLVWHNLWKAPTTLRATEELMSYYKQNLKPVILAFLQAVEDAMDEGRKGNKPPRYLRPEETPQMSKAHQAVLLAASKMIAQHPTLKVERGK